MITKKQLTGGMNLDDSEVLMDKSEYLGAFNMRFVGNDSKDGPIANIDGNVKLFKTINDVGTVVDFVLEYNTTIGAYEDTPNRRVIFLNFSDINDHGIYCYDADTDLIYTVLKSSQVTGGLNFQKGKFIHSIGMIGNLMYWTDNFNEPRRINIEAGIKRNHPTYVTTEAAYPATLDANMIGLIRPQPAFPIVSTFITDNTNTNPFTPVQACYRFVYRDEEVSTFSSLSNLADAGLSNGYTNFQIPITQKIPVDVIKIELAVKFLDGGKYFIYKTWSQPTDAAAIAAHNAGTALTYKFYNDSIGVAVSDAVATETFDSVPLLAGTLELTKNRLFMANTLSGYESPTTTSLAATTSSSTNVNQLRAFKTGATYKLGVVFYDDAGRYAGVVAGATVKIPDRIEDMATWTTYINWTLQNGTGAGGAITAADRTRLNLEIPTWAKYYSIVRTKAKRTSSFAQFRCGSIKQIYKDATGQFVAADSVPAQFSLYGIGVNTTELTKFGLGYAYEDGDVAYIYNGTAAPYKVKVLGTFSDFVITEPFSFTTSDVVIVELDKAPVDPSTDYYYEIGNKYAVANAGTDIRTYSATTAGLLGDVVIKQRPYLATSVYVEVMNYNDLLWDKWYTSAGRVMIESNAKVLRNKTNMIFSDVFNFGVNGLSSFSVLNFTVLPLELATVQKLISTSKIQSEGSVLLAVGEGETATIYLGETQVFDNKGASFLATSSGVVGNINILKGSYGTIHPEGVSRWQGAVYFFDSNKGKVIRYDLNGLQAISDAKLTKYFRKLGADIIASYKDGTKYNNANPNLPLRINTITDPYTGEFLIHAPRMDANIQNEQLTDMILGANNYNFDVQGDCNFTGRASSTSPSVTPTSTPSVTPSITGTATPTITPSVTPTTTLTGTPTVTPTPMPENKFLVNGSPSTSAAAACDATKNIYLWSFNDQFIADVTYYEGTSTAPTFPLVVYAGGGRWKSNGTSALQIDDNGLATNLTACNITPTVTPTITVYTYNLGFHAVSGYTACDARQDAYYSIDNEFLFGNDTVLYTDAALTTLAPNGYYSNGTNFWRIIGGNGTLTAQTSCIPPTPTTTTTLTPTVTPTPPTSWLLSSGTTGQGACANTTTNTYYAAPFATLAEGTILYTDAALTTPVPTGYYSDGTNYYWVKLPAGDIFAVGACLAPTPTITYTPTYTPTVGCFTLLVNVSTLDRVNADDGYVYFDYTPCYGGLIQTVGYNTNKSSFNTGLCIDGAAGAPIPYYYFGGVRVDATNSSAALGVACVPVTPTATGTATGTPTVTPTITPTGTITNTPTVTVTPVTFSLTAGCAGGLNTGTILANGFSGGSGSFEYIAISSVSPADAIAKLNNSATRIFLGGATEYTFTSLGNATWYVALQSYGGVQGVQGAAVLCLSPTPTVTPTGTATGTSTSTPTYTETPVSYYQILDCNDSSMGYSIAYPPGTYSVNQRFLTNTGRTVIIIGSTGVLPGGTLYSLTYQGNGGCITPTTTPTYTGTITPTSTYTASAPTADGITIGCNGYAPTGGTIQVTGISGGTGSGYYWTIDGVSGTFADYQVVGGLANGQYTVRVYDGRGTFHSVYVTEAISCASQPTFNQYAVTYCSDPFTTAYITLFESLSIGGSYTSSNGCFTVQSYVGTTTSSPNISLGYAILDCSDPACFNGEIP